MSEILNELALKLLVTQTAQYATDEVFGKSREDFEKEVAELPARDLADYFENENCVHEEFEEGGRWSNYETKVYRHWHNSEFVYVSIHKEVPASETQEGGDFQEPEISVVYPHKIETTVYKSTPQDTDTAKGRR